MTSIILPETRLITHQVATPALPKRRTVHDLGRRGVAFADHMGGTVHVFRLPNAIDLS